MSATAAPVFQELDQLRRRRSKKWRTYDEDVLPLWVAEMDVALAPPVADALATAVRLGDTGYPHPGALTEAYVAFSGGRYGWAPVPERISLVPDVMTGIAEVLRLVTGPGDGVVINPPVYPPFWDFVRHAGRRVVEAPLVSNTHDAYRIDFGALERAFACGARAYLLCNPHNPTGSVFTREELAQVATLAGCYGVRVLADEIHAPLTYPGAQHVPFLSLSAGAAERAVAFVSATKGWNLPGLKAGLAIAGPEAEPDIRNLPHEVQKGASLFGVIASQAAFERGVPWLDLVMETLDTNRRLLADLLATHLPQVRYRIPDATYLAWLDCRASALGDDPAGAFLTRGRVALSAGHTFGAPGRGFARLNFATSRELLTEAVQCMASALADP